MFSSMSPGRDEEAPQALSAEGQDKVMRSDEVKQLWKLMLSELDVFTKKYSVAAARAQKALEYLAYEAAENRYKLVLRREREAERNREYQEHQRSNATLVREEFERLAGDDTESLPLANKVDGVFSEDDGVDDGPNDKSPRTHGVYRHHEKQRLAEGTFYETNVLLPHRFDSILVDTSKPSLSDLDVTDQVIPFFGCMHGLERYGRLEPPPSSFICITCGVDQRTKLAFDGHNQVVVETHC